MPPRLVLLHPLSFHLPLLQQQLAPPLLLRLLQQLAKPLLQLQVQLLQQELLAAQQQERFPPLAWVGLLDHSF